MNKSILMSVRPEHLINILNGNKTLELRKTFPKDFIGWVYLYCSIGDYVLIDKEIEKEKYYNIEEARFLVGIDKHSNPKGFQRSVNGKVVARFWFDEIEYVAEFSARALLINALNRLCITENEFKNYLKGKYGYAWCIKKLEIFDEPLMLSDFYQNDNKWSKYYKTWERLKDEVLEKYTLKRAPQSWQYVYMKELEK